MLKITNPRSQVILSPFLREPLCPLRSEEHTSELQSRLHLVCRLLLEKKKRFHSGDLQQTHTHTINTSLYMVLSTIVNIHKHAFTNRLETTCRQCHFVL